MIYTTSNGELSDQKTIELGTDSHPKAIDYFNGKILVGLRNGTIVEFHESSPQEKKNLL